MKKYFKFFAIATILVAGLAGCSNETQVDNETNGTPAVDDSELTYATFTFPDVQSTKTFLDDATPVEQIRTVRLLVYKDAPDAECEIDTTCAVSAAPFTSLTVLVKSGPKRIFAIANDASGGSSTTAPNPKSGFPIAKQTHPSKKLEDLILLKTGTPAKYATEYHWPTTTSSDFFSSIVGAGTNEFVYANSYADTSSLRTLNPSIPITDSKQAAPTEPGVNSPKNHFIIYVKRPVAKMRVTTTVAASGDIPVNDGSGKLASGSITFGARNLNKGVALIQYLDVTGKPRAPFFDDVTVSNAATFSYSNCWYSGTAAELIKPVKMGASLPITAAAGDYVYIPENASSYTVRANATYAAIKARFIPTAVVNYMSLIPPTGGNNGSVMNVGTTTTLSSTPSANSFFKLVALTDAAKQKLNAWGLGKIESGTLFNSKLQADTAVYAAANNGALPAAGFTGFTPATYPAGFTVETYDGGICYYRWNIQTASDPYVARNNSYNVNITQFSALGVSAIDSLDSGGSTPLDQPTYITATIRIVDWTQVDNSATV
ncbi:MAG: fimbria major subunit [Tannerellaceae bacterium]|nr:fimbria major subunit [Tannerellaceae bacterium]